VLLQAYDDQLRGVPRSAPAGVTYEVDGPITRVVGQFRGFIAAPRDVGLRGTSLDTLIARQRDFFAARGEAVEWKTRGHDEPADLPDRLRAAGFEPEELETVLIGVALEMAASPLLPEHVILRSVTAREDLDRIAHMQSTVWGGDSWDWLADDLAGRLEADPAELEILVAEAADEVVSAAWIVYRPDTDFAGLWGGSTLPEWRGKGIYRSLVAERANRAVARGVRYLQVDASADSAPILQRLGFKAVTTTTPYVWRP
jgi:GNAT superfamily N-acetyltransferase